MRCSLIVINLTIICDQVQRILHIQKITQNHDYIVRWYYVNVIFPLWIRSFFSSIWASASRTFSTSRTYTHTPTKAKQTILHMCILHSICIIVAIVMVNGLSVVAMLHVIWDQNCFPYKNVLINLNTDIHCTPTKALPFNSFKRYYKYMFASYNLSSCIYRFW